jgi:hypothetical protein
MTGNLDRCSTVGRGAPTGRGYPLGLHSPQFTVAADAGIGIEADWVSVTV